MSFWRKLFVLALSILAMLGLSYLYTTKVNPEVTFWKAVSEKQAEWVPTLEGKRYVFTGGSSCVFSVNPVVLKEGFGLSVVNAAAGAGLGRPFHLDSANRFLREGDVLVLNFETDFWKVTQPIASTPLGTSAWFSYLRQQQGDFILSEAVRGENNYKLSEVRSGGEHFILMGTKFLLGRKFYRYTVEDIHAGGYCTTDAEVQFSGGKKLTSSLSLEAREFLIKLKGILAERGIGLMVNIPWKCTHEEVLEEERKNIKGLMAEINEVCPVIPDPYFGCRSEREVFADSGWHLTEKSANERCEIIGRFLSSYRSPKAGY